MSVILKIVCTVTFCGLQKPDYITDGKMYIHKPIRQPIYRPTNYIVQQDTMYLVIAANPVDDQCLSAPADEASIPLKVLDMHG